MKDKDYKNMSLEEVLEYRLNLIREINGEEEELQKLKSNFQYNTEIIIRLLADHIPWFLHRCPLLLQEKDKKLLSDLEKKKKKRRER